MENELAIRNVDELARVSQMLAKSNLFVKDGMNLNVMLSTEQCAAKIMAGKELGVGPIASINSIHIIKGKFQVGYKILASLIKASRKYDYKLLEFTPTKCTVQFYEDGEPTLKNTVTIEEARKSGTKNLDKHPKIMLFSNCIAQGASVACPEVYSGISVYTEEEISQIPDTDQQPNQLPVTNDQDSVIDAKFAESQPNEQEKQPEVSQKQEKTVEGKSSYDDKLTAKQTQDFCTKIRNHLRSGVSDKQILEYIYASLGQHVTVIAGNMTVQEAIDVFADIKSFKKGELVIGHDGKFTAPDPEPPVEETDKDTDDVIKLDDTSTEEVKTSTLDFISQEEAHELHRFIGGCLKDVKGVGEKTLVKAVMDREISGFSELNKLEASALRMAAKNLSEGFTVIKAGKLMTVEEAERMEAAKKKPESETPKNFSDPSKIIVDQTSSPAPTFKDL